MLNLQNKLVNSAPGYMREGRSCGGRGKRLVLAPCLVLVFLFGRAVAQQPVHAEPAQDHGLRITGKVVDARSGTALARCSVQIELIAKEGFSRSVTTGDGGGFSFDGLVQGKYRLSAARHGYLAQSYEEHEGSFFTAVVVGAGLESEDLIFALVPQAILSGIVSDEAGDPIRGAQVRLFEDRDREGLQAIQLRQQEITDDRGIYEFRNVAPGNYYLAVSAQPWYAHRFFPAFQGGRQQEDEQETNSVLDVAYPTTFYIAATDSDDATPIPVRGGERIESSLSLVPQHAVRFHLKLPGGAPQNGSGYNVALSQTVFGQTDFITPGMQTLQGDGLEVQGILPGKYDVVLNRYSTGASPPEQAHFSVDVGGGTTEIIGGPGAGEAAIVGKIVSPEGAVSSGSVSLVSRHPQRFYPGMLNDHGEFTLHVPPGDYEIVGQIPRLYIANIASQDAKLEGRMLQVKAGDSAKLTITMGKGFGQIDGFVQRGKRPASGVMVLLAPEDAKNNRILFRRDQSDSDGSFTIASVVPGRYRLLAIDRGWDLEWANPNVLAAFLPKSVPVEVHASDKLTQTIEVQSR